MTNLQRWTMRLGRYRSRAEISFDLLLGAASWHLQGGRRRAAAEFREVVENHRWCFIVGCNNSGTSLLQGILEKSGLVSTFPHEGQRYTRALRLARKRGHERVWSEHLDQLRLETHDDLRPARRLAHDWMRKLEQPIQEMIVEKTTANAVRMLWLQAAFPRSYFIGLVRNGFAVTEGIHRKGHKSVGRGARHWNRVNELMLQDAQDVDRFILVHYEDLVADPQAVARRLAEFLSLDGERLVRATAADYGLDSLSGRKRQSISDMNRDSVSRLSEADIETIWRVAGQMLGRFGYTADGAVARDLPPPKDATHVG